MIILLFFIFSSSVFSNPQYSDIELITMVDIIVSKSLQKLEKMGQLGEEKIEGDLGGVMNYSTKLTGFNKVLNIVEYIEFQDHLLVLSGIIKNDVNWVGSGKSLSIFFISGIEIFSLKIEINLKNKVSVGGRYTITREGLSHETYSFDILSNN